MWLCQHPERESLAGHSSKATRAEPKIYCLALLEMKSELHHTLVSPGHKSEENRGSLKEQNHLFSISGFILIDSAGIVESQRQGENIMALFTEHASFCILQNSLAGKIK